MEKSGVAEEPKNLENEQPSWKTHYKAPAVKTGSEIV
jgi:hypothetical protein